MKVFLQILTVLLSQSFAIAAVNPSHAMNVFKGDYKFTDHLTGSEITFEVKNNGEVLLKDNDTYYKAKSAVNALGNDIGPAGLSIMTIMLAGGSDEQTSTLHIRIFPHQETRTESKLLDIIYVENDGPNDLTSASSWAKVKIYKKTKTGLFAELSKAH